MTTLATLGRGESEASQREAPLSAWAAHSFTAKDPYPPYPIGWKAKIGVLLPAVDTGWGTYDFRRLSPEGVVTLETRVPMSNITLETLRGMRDSAVQAAKLLACAEPDVITYEATAAGFVLGIEGDKELRDEITAATGIPATTGAHAVVEALRDMQASKISIVDSTRPEITATIIDYLEKKGFSVAGHKSMAFNHVTEGNRMSPQELYSIIKRFHKTTPGVDTIFVASGCFRTLEIIPAIEQDFGVNVVATVPANMWHCLKIADYRDPIPGYGKLLDRPR